MKWNFTNWKDPQTLQIREILFNFSEFLQQENIQDLLKIQPFELLIETLVRVKLTESNLEIIFETILKVLIELPLTSSIATIMGVPHPDRVLNLLVGLIKAKPSTLGDIFDQIETIPRSELVQFFFSLFEALHPHLKDTDLRRLMNSFLEDPKISLSMKQEANKKIQSSEIIHKSLKNKFNLALKALKSPREVIVPLILPSAILCVQTKHAHLFPPDAGIFCRFTAVHGLFRLIRVF